MYSQIVVVFSGMKCSYDEVKGFHSNGADYIDNRTTIDACRQLCDELSRGCVAFRFKKWDLSSSGDCLVHWNIEKKDKSIPLKEYVFVKKCPSKCRSLIILVTLDCKLCLIVCMFIFCIVNCSNQVFCIRQGHSRWSHYQCCIHNRWQHQQSHSEWNFCVVCILLFVLHLYLYDNCSSLDVI